MRKQVYRGGYGIDTMSRISKKAIDKFQCIWVVMINKLYELIVKYLGKMGLNKNLLAI